MIFPRSLLAGLAPALVIASTASAQFTAYPDETIAIAHGPSPSTLALSWFGHAGRAYFLQYTPTLETADSWTFLPFVEPGANATLTYGASAPTGEGGRFFARTVVQSSSSTNPAFEDFDGDKVSSMDEIQAGLNPLSSANTDGDSLPDDWERFYFGSLTHDGSADSDGDGISDADEYAAGRHPNTSIVYGTVTYDWAGEDSATKTVFFRDDRNTETSGKSETAIAVEYSDTALTRPVSIKIYYGYDIVAFMGYYTEVPKPQWLLPTVKYFIASSSPSERALVFTGHTVGTRTGRDLLRKIDGRVYGYVTSPSARRAPAYLAITSSPLTTVNTGQYPTILRDFPYHDEAYPDFGFNRHGRSTEILADELEPASITYERLPVYRQDKWPVASAESFHEWYRKLDALAVKIGRTSDANFERGFSGIWETDLLRLQENDVGATFGRLCFTLETHLKLDYNIDPESPSKTMVKVSADDSVWVYVNGHLVLDYGGGGGGDALALSDFPDIFPSGSTTGTCDVAIFYAEQQYSSANLRFQSNSVSRPVYAYQVVADTGSGLTPTFSLNAAPSGMTISQTGKIFWDYSQVPSGTYAVELQVTAGFGNISTQAFSITVDNAPVFLVNPANLDVRTSDEVVFSAVAAGSGLAYQWLKNDVPISGATGSTLTLSNVQPGDAGNYSLRATNSQGTATSAPAALVVNNSPYVRTYPDSVSVNVGESALFTVVATGTSLTYQWYKYDEEWNEVALPGKTAATLTFASVTASDEGWYFVVITNPDGQTYASADLYVNDHTP